MCPGVENSIRGEDAFGDLGNNDTSCSYPFPYQRPPGFIVPLYYDPMDQRFKLFTRPGVDYSSLTTFSVFTTTGTAQMVSDSVRVYTASDYPYSRTVYTTLSNHSTALLNAVYLNNSLYSGNIDCDTNTVNMNEAFECIQKNDMVFFLDPSLNHHSLRSNPKYLNVYTVAKIDRLSLSEAYVIQSSGNYNNTGLNRITLNMGINSAWSIASETDNARVYVFRPKLSHPNRKTAAMNNNGVIITGQGHRILSGSSNSGGDATSTGGYQYVSECSNRGNCNYEIGECVCFPGFVGDSCSIQNNIVS